MSKDITKEIKIFAEGLKSHKNILDVGCGLRPYEQFFNKCNYTGIDVEISGRDKDSKLPDKFFDGLNIPFNKNTFDVVICTEVLEHCTDPNKLLSETYRVLKDDGVIFFTVPFIWGEHEIPYDFRRYSSYGIIKVFEEIGFKILSFKKTTVGIKAIELLVSSEINNYKGSVNHNQNLWSETKEFIFNHVWSILLQHWDSMYNFSRIYINNVIIARK